jgi:hypothetical protein
LPKKIKASSDHNQVLFWNAVQSLEASREGSQYEGLPERDTGDRQAAFIIRLDTAFDEGGMGREYSGGTPWLRYRLGSNAFLHSTAKIAKVHGIARDILRQARQWRRWV